MKSTPSPSRSWHSRAVFLALIPIWTAAVANLPAAIESPLEIPGHVLWLDSDDFDGDSEPDTGSSGTPAVTWVDKSDGLGDNSVNTTGGEPTFQYGEDGAPNSVRFFGASQDKMDNSAFRVEGNYTLFTVVHSMFSGGSGHVLSGINQAGTDAVLYRNGAGSFRIYSGQTSGNTDLAIGFRSGDSGRVLLGYQVNEMDQDLGFFQNSTATFELNGPALLDGIRIGNLDRGTPSDPFQSEAFSGDIFEIIIYDRVLTTEEITDVSDYLNAKYDLQFLIPTGAMSEIESGMVTGGIPSTLDPASEALTSGRTNLALAANGGLAFSQDYIGPGSPRDFRPWRLNDGFYADPEEGAPPIQEPWIAASHLSFAGIAFPAPVTIDRIGFEHQFDNRRNGQLAFEYTTDALTDIFPDENLGLDPFGINDLTWTLLDAANIQDTFNLRRLYGFAPLSGVTAIRIRMESSAAEFAISELEVWGTGSAPPALPVPVITAVAVGAGEITLEFTRPFPATGFTYRLEASIATSGWSTVPGAVFSSQGQTGGVETVQVTLPRPADLRYFMRIKVTANP